MNISGTVMSLLFVLLGLSTPLALAADSAASAEQIAGIVASMNHFPSETDKAALMAIAADDSISQAVRDMASTVARIQHFPDADGKAAMASIVANEQVTERGRVLAGIEALSMVEQGAVTVTPDQLTLQGAGRSEDTGDSIREMLTGRLDHFLVEVSFDAEAVALANRTLPEISN